MIRALLALLLSATPALAEDGAAVFRARCASCHAAAADAPPGAGPNLAGVLGRRVGGERRFSYSPVLEAAGEHGDTWTAERLREFLADPEEMYPGVWMGANRLRDAADRDAVVAFLRAAPGG